MGVDAMVLGIGGGAGGSERLLLVLEKEQLRTFSKSCIAFWPGGCSSILRKRKETSYVTESLNFFAFHSYLVHAGPRCPGPCLLSQFQGMSWRSARSCRSCFAPVMIRLFENFVLL